jgi:hypothetical protein
MLTILPKLNRVRFAVNLTLFSLLEKLNSLPLIVRNPKMAWIKITFVFYT